MERITRAIVSMAALAIMAAMIEQALPEGKLREAATRAVALVTLLAAARLIMSVTGLV